MNTETGKIYMNEEIDEAIKRGESVVPVSAEVVKLMSYAERYKKQLDFDTLKKRRKEANKSKVRNR